MRVTSAYANKILKQLNEEKEYWLNREKESMIYTASADEDPVIPDYDYDDVSGRLTQIDMKICKIKHAINQSNINSVVEIYGEEYSIDSLLVRMAQISKRKMMLDKMRKKMPKSRIGDDYYSRKPFVEYRYVNYDIEQVKNDYDEISRLLFEMQLKLDEHNQEVEFEIEFE